MYKSSLAYVGRLLDRAFKKSFRLRVRIPTLVGMFFFIFFFFLFMFIYIFVIIYSTVIAKLNLLTSFWQVRSGKVLALTDQTFHPGQCHFLKNNPFSGEVTREITLNIIMLYVSEELELNSAQYIPVDAETKQRFDEIALK